MPWTRRALPATASLVLIALMAASPSPTLAAPSDDDSVQAAGPDATGLDDGPPSDRPDSGESPEGSPDALQAPGPSSPPPDYLERYSRPFVIDGQELKFTQKYYWHQLFHPDSKDKAWGAGVLMTSFVLASQKWRIQADVSEDDSPPREHFFRTAQNLGGRGIVPGIAVLFYLGGSAFRDYHAKQTGIMLGESAFLTGVLTLAGQWILSEDRPRDGGRLHPFQGIGHGVSGHTSTAASMAGILSRQYLQINSDDGRVARTFKWIGKGLAYGAPVAVAFGRVNEQEHFAYSTILGLGIGFWTSNTVADAHGLYLDRKRSALRPTSAGPIVGADGGMGLCARWSW
jgi:hypothetical protein